MRFLLEKVPYDLGKSIDKFTSFDLENSNFVKISPREALLLVKNGQEKNIFVLYCNEVIGIHDGRLNTTSHLDWKDWKQGMTDRLAHIKLDYAFKIADAIYYNDLPNHPKDTELMNNRKKYSQYKTGEHSPYSKYTKQQYDRDVGWYNNYIEETSKRIEEINNSIKNIEEHPENVQLNPYDKSDTIESRLSNLKARLQSSINDLQGYKKTIITKTNDLYSKNPHRYDYETKLMRYAMEKGKDIIADIHKTEEKIKNYENVIQSYQQEIEQQKDHIKWNRNRFKDLLKGKSD